MEKKAVTELVFVLDGSGSMGHLTEDTIGGFNSMIKDQIGKGSEKIVTTVVFNTEPKTLYTRLPIAEVPELTEKEYVACGMTALCDAVAITMNDIMNRQISDAIQDPENRPAKTLFFITTDGRENASRNYTADSVRVMIQNAQEKNGWEFIYIGASMDDVRTGRSLGIRDKNIACFRETSGEAECLKFRAMNKRIRKADADLIRDAKLEVSLEEEACIMELSDDDVWKEELEKNYGFEK